MKAGIGTPEYYSERRPRCRYIALLRKYVAGHPYIDDPKTRESSQSLALSNLWAGIMQPSEALAPEIYPEYMHNIAAWRLNRIAWAMLPRVSRLKFRGVEGEQEQELFRLLLNFGPDYPAGTMTGLMRWARTVAREAALSGDGLIVPSYEPDVGVLYSFYPHEHCDWVSDENFRRLFYRIEFKFKHELTGQYYWFRRDIYRERIEYWHNEPIVTTSKDGKPGPNVTATALESDAGWVPKDMRIDDAVDEETRLIEEAILSQVGEFLAVPVFWRKQGENDHRGDPEFQVSDLQAFDNANRLRTRQVSSTIKHGDPPLLANNMEFKEDEPASDDDPEIRTHPGQNELRPGEVVATTSEERENIYFGYPANAPRELLHEATIRMVEGAGFSNAPHLAMDPVNVGRIAELSGFGYQLLNQAFEEMVGDQREAVFELGLFKALSIGLKILKAYNRLPERVDVDAEPYFDYGGQPLSPNEMEKLTVTLAGLKEQGVPAQDRAKLVKQIVPPEDMDSLIKAMDEKDNEDLLAQLVEPGGRESPEASSDVDKRVR